MKKQKIMFIKPALESDAIWSIPRSCSNLGMLYLASMLREKGYEVRYLDENGEEQTTNYLNCKLSESTSIFNEYRNHNNGEEFRIRLAQVQYYDLMSVNKIYQLDSTLGILPIASLPIVGFNKYTGALGLAVTGTYNRKWVLTEYSLTPIYNLGDEVVRVKYKWETWTEWMEWA